MKELIKSLIPDKLLLEYRNYKLKKRRKNRLKRAEYFKGNDVQCPICESSYKIFDTYGLKKRKNARCYHCEAMERHRLIFLYLKNKTNFFNQGRLAAKVLHFAPEKTFYNLFSELASIEYFPCDLFPENYDYDGKTLISKVDITKIPYDDNFFDFIICNHVLEHIPNDKMAMSELYRVMKKDGGGIIQVPIDYEREETFEDWSITTPKEREKAFGQHDHVRWYGRDYKRRLENVGFKVNEDRYAERFSDKELFRYGIYASQIIYYCEK